MLRDDVAALGMDAWSEKLMPLRFHEGALSEESYRWFHDVQRGSAPHACVDLVDMLVQGDFIAEGELDSHPLVPHVVRYLEWRRAHRATREAGGSGSVGDFRDEF